MTRGTWPAEPRRVVVTGMGMLTALGNDVASTWEGLVAGRSGIATITAFDPSRLTARIAGEVKDFDASHILDRKEVRRTDRYIQFGLVASRQAMDQAGLPARLEGDEAERTGVILGTGLGGVGTLVEGISINALRGPDRISPFLIPMGIPNVGAGQVAISFGMTGPNFTTVSACATGGHAIGEASETIRRGDADVMIAGGTEAGVYEPLVGGFAAMRALSTPQRRPRGRLATVRQGPRRLRPRRRRRRRSSSRSSSTPRRRGATILAELIGYGATADASHITLPAPGGIGAVRAARRALEKAGIAADEIDHVNAHATSTPEGDKAELQSIRTIFGDRAGEVPITANKSMLGHTLGAAGAIEAIVTIQSIRESCVPPTINLDDPDDAAEGLNLTPQHGPGARHPDRDVELVRVRRPEHRPDLPAVGSMTDELERPPDAAADAETVAEPAAARAGRRADRGSPAARPADIGDASLLALIDRLGGMLERSDLTELEVEVGGTALILRKPAAIAQPVLVGAGADAQPAAAGPVPASTPSAAPAGEERAAAPSRPSIKAPLTGIWYGSPAPGSAPFVEVGREVAVGQVVGLIEAMKLFNEIKSDLAGRVVRVVPESGSLVKAKQPLIEVEPL